MSEYQAVLQQPTDGRMLVIGCHLSSAKGYAAMAKTAASIDANTFAFFTRNPRGGKAKAIDDADVRAFAEEAALAGIGRIVAHGSYTVNPCAQFRISGACRRFGANGTHPGAVVQHSPRLSRRARGGCGH